MLKLIGKKFVAVVTAFSFIFATVPVASVHAAMIDNDTIIESQSVAEDRLAVQAFIERPDVQKQFESLGVDPAEAQKRIAALSDKEIVTLADQIESAPAGQGALGAVIGAAVLIFIILLITDLLGFTDVFGFTNKGSANPAS